MFRVVVTFPFHEHLIRTRLKPYARVTLARTRPALERALAQGAEGLISLLTDRVDEQLLSRAPKLRAVANVAVGVDNIDLPACKRHGIRVANTPDVLTRATAELAAALLLAAARRVPEGHALCASGRFKGWAPDLLPGLELRGRHAVIVGAGRIGRETGRLFKALGLTVEYLTREMPSARIQAALKRAQVLSLHTPLTPATRHWLDARRIRLLPRDAIVINTARGPVIDERALATALKARRIFAAGLDVYEREPEIDGTLRRLPNVVLLPHLGSATIETRAAMARLAIDGLLELLRGKRPANALKF